MKELETATHSGPETGGDAAQEMLEAEELEAEQDSGDGDPMTDEEILSIIAQEMSNAATGNFRTEIDSNREEALDYYIGNPRGDEQEGRSTIVSTDVADAIEWILPQIMNSLVSKGPVISFDAMGDGDEIQAELETEFTHDVFMKQNEGFLNLYNYVKDALMQKNGIFKIYYDDTPTSCIEDYSGLNDAELEQLLSAPNVELLILEQEVDEERVMAIRQQVQQAEKQLPQMPPEQQKQITQRLEDMKGMPPPMLSTVKVRVAKDKGNVEVECLAPEEFRVNQYHNSLNLKNARFTAHVTLKTRSELVEDGYDKDTIYNAASNLSNNYEREHRFSAQGESVVSDPNYSGDESQELLEVSECYIMLDADRTGIAQLTQVMVLGSDDPTNILDREPVDTNPFVSSSSIIMSHKFYGLSIYDRLKQLQDQKTSLWRNILDNLYLQNNREKEVVEGKVNLDDLLISRPGGVKRVKAPGMIRELEVQPIGQEGYQMLDYLDQVRTGRVGVSPDTAGALPVGMDTAHGVERLQTAKEELTGLMIRAIVETGLKQAYVMIRDLLIKNQDSTTSFKFKGQWQNINPMAWGDRSSITVNVGTGTGNEMRKQSAMQQVLTYQTAAIQQPGQALVDEQRIYNALDDFCKVAGLQGGGEYFLDPQTPEGQKNKQQVDQKQQQAQQKDEQLKQAMAQAQVELGKAESMKGQAAIMSQQAKIKVEQMKLTMEGAQTESENEKAALQMELDRMAQQLKAMESSKSLQFDYDKLHTEEALKLTEMEHKYNLENKKLVTASEVNKQQQQEGADNG